MSSLASWSYSIWWGRKEGKLSWSHLWSLVLHRQKMITGSSRNEWLIQSNQTYKRWMYTLGSQRINLQWKIELPSDLKVIAALKGPTFPGPSCLEYQGKIQIVDRRECNQSERSWTILWNTLFNFQKAWWITLASEKVYLINSQMTWVHWIQSLSPLKKLDSTLKLKLAQCSLHFVHIFTILINLANEFLESCFSHR